MNAREANHTLQEAKNDEDLISRVVEVIDSLNRSGLMY